MKNEILIAIVTKLVEDKISEIPVLSGSRGPRGFTGRDGKDFVFSDHEEQIRQWAKDFALKFEDLTTEQILKLRGPKGRDGRDGVDGKDGKNFSLEDYSEEIREIISEVVSGMSEDLRLRFSDLSPEEIEQIRGPRGRDGKPGRDFNFEEHKEYFDSLKLKFTDLTASEIELLRGPAGRKGRDGRDFIFDEHKEYFESLRPKFSDFTEEEKEELKLKFSSLTEDEKRELKLRFEDLTPEDLLAIRGPRGPRGQRGSSGKDGVDGKTGLMGPRGLPGPQGIPGARGADGRDGEDGKDAPYIVDIEVEQYGDEIVFVFEFSDRYVIKTNRVELPVPPQTYIFGGGGGSGGGSLEGALLSANNLSDLTDVEQARINLGIEGPSAEWLPYNITGGQAETPLDGESFSSIDYTAVTYRYYIVRGDTINTNGYVVFQKQDGVWRKLEGPLEGEDHGVTFTLTGTATKQLNAAATAGDDGVVRLSREFVPAVSSGNWTGHNLVADQPETALTGEVFTSADYSAVIYKYEIIRGSAINATGKVTCQKRDGAWRVLLGPIDGEDHGVQFTLTGGATQQLNASAGAGDDGTIKLLPEFIPI